MERLFREWNPFICFTEALTTHSPEDFAVKNLDTGETCDIDDQNDEILSMQQLRASVCVERKKHKETWESISLSDKRTKTRQSSVAITCSPFKMFKRKATKISTTSTPPTDTLMLPKHKSTQTEGKGDEHYQENIPQNSGEVQQKTVTKQENFEQGVISEIVEWLLNIESTVNSSHGKRYLVLLNPCDIKIDISQKLNIGIPHAIAFKGVYLGTEVAVKVLASEDQLERHDFAREIVTYSMISHPNILSFIGYATQNNKMMLILEFYDKNSLFHVLHKNQEARKMLQNNPNIRHRMAMEILKAAAYLHSLHVLHKNLNTQNILVDSDFHIKIADFGRISPELSQSTRKNHCYDLYYAAPEVISGSQYQKASDIYSFAIVLWEIYTTSYPYSETPFLLSNILLYNIENGRRPDSNGMPPRLTDLLSSCWHHNPNHRPTFIGIMEALKDISFRRITTPPETFYNLRSDAVPVIAEPHRNQQFVSHSEPMSTKGEIPVEIRNISFLTSAEDSEAFVTDSVSSSVLESPTSTPHKLTPAGAGQLGLGTSVVAPLEGETLTDNFSIKTKIELSDSANSDSEDGYHYTRNANQNRRGTSESKRLHFLQKSPPHPNLRKREKSFSEQHDQKMWDIIKKKDILSLKSFIIEKPELINSKDLKYGASPLHYAAGWGNVRMVKLLLDAKANLNIPSENEFTPLHTASSQGKAEIVKLLVSCVADINVKGRAGYSALHLAALGGHLEASKVLVNAGIDVHLKSQEDETALDIAAESSNSDLVNLLLPLSLLPGRNMMSEEPKKDDTEGEHMANSHSSFNHSGSSNNSTPRSQFFLAGVTPTDPRFLHEPSEDWQPSEQLELTASDSQFEEEKFLCQAESGVRFLKHYRRGKPRERMVVINKAKQTLSWKADKTVSFSEIVNITAGKETFPFQLPLTTDIPEEHCFSIHLSRVGAQSDSQNTHSQILIEPDTKSGLLTAGSCDDETRTLDFQAVSKDVRDLWVKWLVVYARP